MDLAGCMTGDPDDLTDGASYRLKDNSDPTFCCNMCLQSDFVYAAVVNSSQCLCFDELKGQHLVSQPNSPQTLCNVPDYSLMSESTCAVHKPLISCTDSPFPVFRTGLLSEFHFTALSGDED